MCGTAVGTSGRARETGEECSRWQQHMVSSVMSERPCLHLGMHLLLKTSILPSICNIFMFDMLSSGQISQEPSPK